jgi:chromosome segregation ATPase
MNILEDVKKNEDKKIIEILKSKNDDLQKQLQQALVKYYDSEFRMQRAEHQREDFWEIIEKKLQENKEIFQANENLNNQISSITQSLNFSKREVERLNKENTKLKEEEESRLNKYLILEKQYEITSQKAKDFECENQGFKYRVKELTEKLEIQQLTIDRLKNKNNIYEHDGDDISSVKGGNRLNSGKLQSYTLEQKIREQSDEIIKLQIQVHELKKKLSEDEQLRANLFDVIKSKKQKNKSLKNERDKIAFVNEETGKENKWSHDLILQKDNTIKLQKEKLNNLNNEIKNLNKLLSKYKNLKTEDKAVETDGVYDDSFVKVYSSPTAFKVKF